MYVNNNECFSIVLHSPVKTLKDFGQDVAALLLAFYPLLVFDIDDIFSLALCTNN
jgi:hypothetical protein